MTERVFAGVTLSVPKDVLPPQPTRGWGILTPLGKLRKEYSETVEAHPPLFITVEYDGVSWMAPNRLYSEWSARADAWASKTDPTVQIPQPLYMRRGEDRAETYE